MDFDEYRIRGKETVDYLADYLENIRSRRVFPDVVPGYMRELVPVEAPQQGEPWENIFQDVERVIMPGITHWQSPHMHAYFPALTSFPSMLGDMIADGLNCLGFTWASSPAVTELECIVMDWLVKCLGLPDKFLCTNQDSLGGGVLQTSVSESTYYALLAARTKMLDKYGAGGVDQYAEKAEINGKLVCYCSEQAHSSVEKSALVALVRIRLLPTDNLLRMRGETLRAAIAQDKRDGLIPFFVCATLGTTGACAFDPLPEIAKVCQEEDVWLHIDAAYAGSAFFCPEYRHYLTGVEHAQSFVFNPSKWLMTNFDCTAFWVESSVWLHKTFTVAPLYLKHKYSGAAVDYMHWQVGLSRRFRSLKLWFVLRSFGIEGIQKHIRNGVEMAKLFEELVRQDSRFEITAERQLGLVVFRLKGENEITELLLKQLNKDGRLHLVPAKVKNHYVIRFTVTSYYTNRQDIERDWNIIKQFGEQTLIKYQISLMSDESRSAISSSSSLSQEVVSNQSSQQSRQRNYRKSFQSSLLLSNVPQTPKLILDNSPAANTLVNASFLAFFMDSTSAEAAYADLVKEVTTRDYSHSHLPLIPRRKPKHFLKGLSFDQLSLSKSLDPKKTTHNGGVHDLVNDPFDEEEDARSSDDMADQKKQLNLPVLSKQTSLDSKIEYICEEAETQAANNNNNNNNGNHN